MQNKIQNQNRDEKYSLSMRFMHWLVGILVLGMLGAGLYMTSDFIEPQNRMSVYNLHKSFGIIAIFLIIFRLINRLRSHIPPLPQQISHLQKKLALAGHHLMYTLLVLIPLSGFLMSEIGGYPIKFFGYELSHFLPKNPDLARFFNRSHAFLNYTLIGLLFIHLCAPFKHYFCDKVNIWKRMT